MLSASPSPVALILRRPYPSVNIYTSGQHSAQHFTLSNINIHTVQYILDTGIPEHQLHNSTPLILNGPWNKVNFIIYAGMLFGSFDLQLFVRVQRLFDVEQQRKKGGRDLMCKH